MSKEAKVDEEIKRYSEQNQKKKNIPNYRRSTVSLELAKMRFFTNIVKVIEENKPDYDVLIDESFKYIFSKITEMSKEKLMTEISSCMPSGETLMYLASKEGRLEILKLLILKGVNAKVKSKLGVKSQSCLMVACRFGYLDIVKFLLDQNIFDKEEVESCLLLPELDGKVTSALRRSFEGTSCVCSVF